ncbi:MAG: GNAT family N-acetyltransferase [Acidobacteria bacterium]|nr:GNAT family N-acetyltransferase [Acidobacteriota bacterium]MBI3423403.1 GNAT family N-acetyltransferase [Acidobacteriota bacterium]
MSANVFPATIETERLLLRAPQAGDGVAVNAAIRESFAELHQWMPWARVLPSEAETEAFCQEAAATFATGAGFPLFGFLKESGTFVLATDLFVHDWAVPKFEIGYWCRTSAQGRGLVTEAVRALTRVGFETLKANRIQICCDARNVRSRRVAERADYRLEATLRNERIAADGALRTTLLFALLPDEFMRYGSGSDRVVRQAGSLSKRGR